MVSFQGGPGFWVPGELNPVDWCTKTRKAEELMSYFWLRGPDFLLLDISEWPIKFTYKKEGLEGELPIPKPVFLVCKVREFNRLLDRYDSWKKIDGSDLQTARLHLIWFAQKDMHDELRQASVGKGRYGRLAPSLEKGEGLCLWRVGDRLKNHVPFTFDNQLPVILSPDHRITLLLMKHSHQFHHEGHDSTLNRFRTMGYWTVRGGHLAKSVKKSCVLCRKTDAITLTQPMGPFPPEVLADPVAWGYCQLDLFCPFECRSDVNKRSQMKVWGDLGR